MSVVRLENWAVVASRQVAAQYRPPTLHLRGTVYGHPYMPDGTEITSSYITHRRGHQLVSVNGTHYQLGEVNVQYQAHFPQAEEGLLKRIPEKWDEETFPISAPVCTP